MRLHGWCGDQLASVRRAKIGLAVISWDLLDPAARDSKSIRFGSLTVADYGPRSCRRQQVRKIFGLVASPGAVAAGLVSYWHDI